MEKFQGQKYCTYKMWPQPPCARQWPSCLPEWCELWKN